MQSCFCYFEHLRSFELRQRFLLSLLVDIRVLHNTGFEEFKAPESGNRALIRLDTCNKKLHNYYRQNDAETRKDTRG